MNQACISQNTNLYEQNQHAFPIAIGSIQPTKNNFVRMKRIVFFSTIIVLFLGLCSCKKDEKTAEKPVKDGTIVRFVLNGNSPVQELTYTNDGRISEMIESFSYKKYRYNSQHQLEKLELAYSISPFSCAMPQGGAIREGDDPRKAKVTQYFEFNYTGGKLEKSSSFYIVDNNPKLYSYQTYHYRNDTITKISVYNPDGLLMNYQTFTIVNGNVMRDDSYIVENGINVRLIYSNEYEYDTKNNPYQVFACEGTPGVNTNKNNIIKQTMIYYNQGAETRSVIETSYEYNAYGYPSTAGELDFLYIKPTTE